MARYEGTQEIPPELWDAWKKTMGWAGSQPWAKKRMPFELPPMQSTGKRVRQSQLAQRARFIEAKNKFKTVPEAQRERWYDNAPIWNSFLWYYDYFIMSALAGNANTNQGGAGVIKSIQYVSKSIPTAGNESIALSTNVDPDKTVVMLYGNSYISDLIHHYGGEAADNTDVNINLSPNIDPDISEIIVSGMGIRNEETDGNGASWYLKSVSASQLTIRMSNIYSPVNTGYSIRIIEHKSQTIYPFIKSIAADSITIDWPRTPSVAAEIGATVIEYI
jgi:hypothetical protein